jgi:FO synthase
MEALIRSLGRIPRQRLTTYDSVPEERRAASFAAAPLAPVVETPAVAYARRRRSAAAA